MGQVSEGDTKLQTHLNTNVTLNHNHAFDNNVIKLSAVNPAHSYFVVGETPKGRIQFMIDTGAAVSLVRRDVWEQVEESHSNMASWSGCRLVGAEGSTIPVRGVAKLDFTMAGILMTAEFLVTDQLSSEAILGLDFLEQNKCIINAEQHTVHINGKAISLGPRPGKGTSPSTLHVVISERLHIPPLSEMEVTGSTMQSVKLLQGHPYLIEPTDSQTPAMIATAVFSPSLADGERTLIPLRVLNPLSQPITIHKGTKVAQICEIPEPEAITPASSVGLDASTTPSNVPLEAKEELWKLVGKSAANLTAQQQEKLYKVLLGFADVFAFTESELGRTDKLQHTITTETNHPVRLPPRRVPSAHKEEVHQLIQDMLKRDVIQPSASPWASPIVIVRKKDGSARFCVDYRKLNQVTRKDAYPIPRIDDTLDTLSGSKWFSTLDLLSGYWQVEVAEADREKTAFSTQHGLFEFKVMPFGLCNAPATFQRLMDLVLAGVQWSHCLVYLDDIIVVGKDFEEHLQNLSTVLQRIRAANLRLKPVKCSFCREEVPYLGHIVSRNGVSTDPEKTVRVSTWPTPTTALEVQKFLGLASYYRRFVKNYATISSPLHKLTERGRQFKWTDECAQAFSELKHKLTNAPILSFPDFTKPFLLDTDASNSGTGAVLSQEIDGQEKVIAYASRTLGKSEKKYCVTRKELLAMVTFIRHFRPYLLGRKFTLRTDHSSLKWLQQLKEPEGQMARWLEQLQEYNFEIIHRAGNKHANADAMSRRPPCHQCHRGDCVQNDVNCDNTRTTDTQSASSVQKDTTTVEMGRSGELNSDSQNMRKAQLTDDILGPIIKCKEAGEKPDDASREGMSYEARQLYQQWDQLCVHHGSLCRRIELGGGNSSQMQVIVPKALQEVILQEVHAGNMSGHLGGNKTFKRLRERFYWPGYSHDAREWCRICRNCAARKNPPQHRRGPLQNIKAGYPMEIVATDIMGPFPTSSKGNKYILVASDYFTRWVEAYGIPNQEATTVAKALVDNMFCRFSIPRQLHSDQGAQFESGLIKELSKMLQINKTRTTPYHPQSDGLVERLNRTIISMLATTVNDQGGEWEEHLPRVTFAYNTSEQVSTGFTPFYMMFGRQARIPLDIMFDTPVAETQNPNQYVWKLRKSLQSAHDLARNNLKKAACRQKELYDYKVYGKPYAVGDLVWLCSPAVPRGQARKLFCPWRGPFKVTKKINDAVYRIQDTQNRRKRQVVHFNRLKPYNCKDRTDGPNQREKTPPVQAQPTASSSTSAPGTNLQLVEDDFGYEGAISQEEEEQDPGPDSSGADVNPPVVTERRYPLRLNRQKPARYRDGGRDDHD